MEQEVLQKYKKAFEISDEVLKHARDLATENVRVLDVAEKTESKIKDLGGSIAFPVNISINNVAAHYTPDINDELLLKEEDMVKIDVGVHVDGYIADRAFTVFIGKKAIP